MRRVSTIGEVRVSRHRRHRQAPRMSRRAHRHCPSAHRPGCEESTCSRMAATGEEHDFEFLVGHQAHLDVVAPL